MDMTNKVGQMTQEEFAERRAKELAILKAQNEMLEDAKNNLLSMNDEDIDKTKYADVPDMAKMSIDDKVKAIEEAQHENLAAGQAYYGASPKEIESAHYFEPDKSSIIAYERRLKAKGITDEQLRNKKLSLTSYVEDDLEEENTETSKKKSTRRKRMTGKEEEKIEKTVEETNYIVQDTKKEPIETNVIKTETVNENIVDESYNFDVKSIPDYVQYDVIPLPSKGQCYKNKKSRIPVAYLTASDENIIASPNMYRDGKLIDVLLKRKILDKTINVDELVSGDRDAITLWLRATAYGNDFPITATNPNNGKQYDTSVDLSKFKYTDFNLKGDENGYFDYKIGNNVIKYKYFTYSDELKLRDLLLSQMSDSNKVNILRNIGDMRTSLERIDLSDEELKNITEDIDEINEIVGKNALKNSDENMYPKTITEQMIMHIVSVNGNTDRDYIRGFVENMRSGDAMKLRNHFTQTRPGVNLNIKVNIPKSDGGGSFDTFLRIDDSIFITF